MFVQVKYSITDSNFYNFDETDFAVGLISTEIIMTRSDRRERGIKNVQSGN